MCKSCDSLLLLKNNNIVLKAVETSSTGKPLFCVWGNKMNFFLYSTKGLLLATVQTQPTSKSFL